MLAKLELHQGITIFLVRNYARNYDISHRKHNIRNCDRKNSVRNYDISRGKHNIGYCDRKQTSAITTVFVGNKLVNTKI